MDLLLKNLKWVKNNQGFAGDIRIQKGFIKQIDQNLIPQKNERVIQFDNHFIYPGLINSHDHLEMNLYPRLGSPPYPNYTTWGKDIYRPNESPIKQIEKVSLKDRLLWGGVKNLVSGVTTVVHHNPWNNILGSREFPVNVLKKFRWSHSLEFGKNISKALPKDSRTPYIIHLAEGVDALAYGEATQLIKMGLLKSNTVAIHGVALTDDQINFISSIGASMVWCPVSNFFLFNKTATIEKWKGKIKFALGSDSTLTGSSTLLDEMKFALSTDLVNATEIYDMVTQVPSVIFNLPSPQISLTAPANLLIFPTRHSDYHKNLIEGSSSQIELVLKNGLPQLSSDLTASQLTLKKKFIYLNGSKKWAALDVLALKRSIRRKIGDTLALSPLWNMISEEP